MGIFRRRLHYLKDSIRGRNTELIRRGQVPYADLDPLNVSCSTET